MKPTLSYEDIKSRRKIKSFFEYLRDDELQELKRCIDLSLNRTYNEDIIRERRTPEGFSFITLHVDDIVDNPLVDSFLVDLNDSVLEALKTFIELELEQREDKL